MPSILISRERCWMLMSVILALAGTTSLIVSLMVSHACTGVTSEARRRGSSMDSFWTSESSLSDSSFWRTPSRNQKHNSNRLNARPVLLDNDNDEDHDDQDDNDEVIKPIVIRDKIITTTENRLGNVIRNNNNRDNLDQENETGPSGTEDAVCMTPGCIKAAAQILKNMDQQKDPCDDFYQYACGGWVEQQVIPDDKTSLSVFSTNSDELLRKLRVLIERPRSNDDPPMVTQVRNMYNSCRNLQAIESDGSEPLIKDLRYFGGYPVVGKAMRARRQSEPLDWVSSVLRMRERGYSHDILIDLSVVPDIENNTKFIIDLDEASLSLERSYFIKGMNDTTVVAYYQFMIDSAVLLGAPRNEVTRNKMMDVLKFETEMAKLTLPREQRRNASRLYNRYKKSDLYELAPHIDWTNFLDGLLRDHIDDSEFVIVKTPAYLTGIDKLLQTTDGETLQNYMMWRVVRQATSFLSRKWRDLSLNYSNVTTGRQTEAPRWEHCISQLTGTLNMAVSAIYVKNHFKRESKSLAMEMVDYISKEFIKMLKEIDWMDDTTRTEAIKKANAIKPYIGYPDELLDDDKVEKFYEGLELKPIGFYDNMLALRLWSANFAFSNLRKPNLRGDWKKHARAAIVNAFYNSLENSIDFPAAILQDLFFEPDRPKYLNYGAIGWVIGHEITHGFDDRGRQFDRNGIKRNWWQPDTEQRFRERTQCIIDQYSNYTIPENGMKVNGITTQGENIADNGGIKEAFGAYQRWVRDNRKEPRLPGINLNQQQLFWVSAANIWCGKFRPEVLKLRVTSGVHSPARFRIQGTFSNMPQFARSFNCRPNAPMNPVRKCTVW